MGTLIVQRSETALEASMAIVGSGRFVHSGGHCGIGPAFLGYVDFVTDSPIHLAALMREKFADRTKSGVV
jgi:hypothetical protein